MSRTAVIAVLLIAFLLIGASGAMIEQKATLDDKITPIITAIEEKPVPTPTPDYTLINGQKTVGKVSDITINNGDVSVKDTKFGTVISSYTKIDGKKLDGSSHQQGTGLVYESSEGKILGLIGTPTVAVSYAYTDTQLKEQITLQADKAITIPLTLEEGYQLVPLSNGDIRINNPSTMNWWDGVVIKKPFGTDATGKYIEMSYGITGTELSLDYDRSDITYPLVIDPTYVINGITYNYVHPNKFYGTANETVVIRYTIWNTPGLNVTTDLHLGTNIKANFSDIRFMNEDASVQLPAYLNAMNTSLAEILVQAPLTTTGNVVNTFFNSTSGLSNWTAIPGVHTITTTPYYSQDEWRNYSYDGTNEVPVSVAYQDLFGSDTTFRYANASATTGVNWVASAPTDVVVSAGALTLSSDNDVAVSARLKSYKFAGGQIEYSFDHNGDGGGITARDGLWLAMQDLSNSYRITIGDDYAGNENITILNLTAGTMTVMNTTDISAIYTSGAKTWVKTKFEETNGSLWVWVRDDAGSYTAAPQIIATNKLSNNWSYGYAGFYSTVGTAGAGNLNTNFDDFTVNAESIVGYTNIPIGNGRFKPMLRGMPPGEYWNGGVIIPATAYSIDYNYNSSPERETIDTTNSIITWDITNGSLNILNNNGYGQQKVPGVILGDGWYSSDIAFSTTGTSAQAALVICWDGNYASNVPTNAYEVKLINTGIIQVIKRVSGGSTTLYNAAVVGNTITAGGQNRLSFYKEGGLIKLYLNGVYQGVSTLDLSPHLFGYVGERSLSGGSVYTSFRALQISALSQNDQFGVTYTQGSVANGLRYDTNEYAGLAFTVSTPPNNYNLTLPSKATTNTADPTTMQMVFTNTAGTGFSNQTANAMRPLSTVGTTTALNFDNENLQTTVAKGNNYLVYTNYTNWVGTAYDYRGSTKFFVPAIYKSGYSMSPITGAVWANFSTNVSTGSTPIAVAFTDSSEYDPEYPITSWNWSFGDGNYSSSQNPSHLYETNLGTGPVSVRLVVNNTLASDDITRTLTLKTLNSQIYPSGFMSVFWPNGIALQDVSTGTPTAWNWSFGDGSYQTVQNPYHFWAYPGIYTVTLNASTATQYSVNSTQVQVMKWF